MARFPKYDERLREMDAEGLTDIQIAMALTREGFRTATGREIDHKSVTARRWYLNRGKLRPRKPTVADILAECRASGTIDVWRETFALLRATE